MQSASKKGQIIFWLKLAMLKAWSYWMSGISSMKLQEAASTLGFFMAGPPDKSARCDAITIDIDLE